MSRIGPEGYPQASFSDERVYTGFINDEDVKRFIRDDSGERGCSYCGRRFASTTTVSEVAAFNRCADGRPITITAEPSTSPLYQPRGWLHRVPERLPFPERPDRWLALSLCHRRRRRQRRAVTTQANVSDGSAAEVHDRIEPDIWLRLAGVRHLEITESPHG